MKSKADLVRGWLSKAENDLTAIRMCLRAGQALDTACFHAQQAAEKAIKAYLIAYDIDFPFIHNLERLVDLCATREPSFQSIKTLGESLTPYAVDLRYELDFQPTTERAREAYEAAVKIIAFVLDRLPPELRTIKLQETKAGAARYLLAVLLPPVAVWQRGTPRQFTLNVLLTLCLWLPGVIHALYLLHSQPVEKQPNRHTIE